LLVLTGPAGRLDRLVQDRSAVGANSLGHIGDRVPQIEDAREHAELVGVGERPFGGTGSQPRGGERPRLVTSGEPVVGEGGERRGITLQRLAVAGVQCDAFPGQQVALDRFPDQRVPEGVRVGVGEQQVRVRRGA
jgi:hypothetical protein